jgi:large repetitive protein
VNGDTLAEGNETFVVKLSNAVGAVIADNQAMGTIIDEEGMITAYIGDVAVLEGMSGTTTASFNVRLSSPPGVGQNVSVKYATANGTATSGSDYVAVPITTLPFGVGESSKTVTVAINGDMAAEGNETFLVKLSDAVGVVLADKSATGTILNDEGSQGLSSTTLYVSDAAVLEGTSGTTTASFTVSVSSAPAPGQSVTVKYTTGNGSAASGSDYMSVPLTTLTFAAGEWVKTVVVTVNGDTLAEGNETFVVKLSNAVGAVIADNQAMGTIIDEEGMITAYIGDVAVLEGTSGTTTASFTVWLSSPPGVGQNISVKYTTANGTATSGSDYVAVPITTLPFGVGESSKMVTVAVNGDSLAEAKETFLVKLSNPAGVIIADRQATGTIIADE